MKVRCIDQNKGYDGRETGSRLTIGREYQVLTMHVEPNRGFLFRIIGDDHFTPVLFSEKLFEITDHSMPSSWIFTKDARGVFRFSPRPWLEPGFWEKFFDRDPAAVVIFEQQRRLMYD